MEFISQKLPLKLYSYFKIAAVTCKHMSSNFVVYSVDKIPVQFCIMFQETLREKFTWPRIISAFTVILFSVVLYFRNIHNIQ